MYGQCGSDKYNTEDIDNAQITTETNVLVNGAKIIWKKVTSLASYRYPPFVRWQQVSRSGPGWCVWDTILGEVEVVRNQQ